MIMMTMMVMLVVMMTMMTMMMIYRRKALSPGARIVNHLQLVKKQIEICTQKLTTSILYPLEGICIYFMWQGSHFNQEFFINPQNLAIVSKRNAKGLTRCQPALWSGSAANKPLSMFLYKAKQTLQVIYTNPYVMYTVTCHVYCYHLIYQKR